MITRVVKMKFRANGVEPFLDNFNTVKTRIRGFEGCEHLQLWRDVNDKNTFFTYSKWQSEDHLNKYRNSDLFKAVWKFTKSLFDDKPAAWSVQQVEILE
ncbi:MAG: antibiotic biosynthesis monooxygenase [Bacteroidia bacterium]